MTETITLLKAQIPGFFGLYRLFSRGKRFQHLRVIGTVTIVLIVGLLLCGVSLSYSLSFSMALQPLGSLSLLPGLMMTLACLMILFTTLYKSSSILFSGKDTDMLMALPVRTGSIITARILLLYGMDLLFTLVIVVPAGGVYAWMASPGPVYWVYFVIMLLLIPMIPLVISSLLGTLVAAIAARCRHTNTVRTLMTLLFIALLCVVFTLSTPGNASMEIDQLGTTISNMVYSLYPPAYLFADALTAESALSFALFLIASVGAFAVFVALVSWRFKAISSSLASSRARSKFRMTSLKTSSPRKALLMKEFKRLFSSPLYLFNSCIGFMMLVILAIAMLFISPSDLEGILEMPGISAMVSCIFPMISAALISISCTSVCSISLEGKCFWIVRTAPIRANDLFWSKIGVNLILALATSVVCGVLFIISVRPDPIGCILMFAVPAAYSLFISVLGLFLNLMMPRFDWTSEAAVIKRGMATFIAVFGGMISSFVPIGILLATGGAFALPTVLISSGIVLLLIIPMILYLAKCGEKRLLELGEAD